MFARAINRIDKLNQALGHGVAWLALVMVLLQFAVVVLRYVFAIGYVPMQEAVWLLHGLLFFFYRPAKGNLYYALFAASLALILVLPVFYGGLGAVVGAISAAIYNVAAGSLGGVRLELEEALY